MAKVKLDLRSKSDSQILLDIRAVITKLTGNANFPTTLPTLSQLTARANAYETALQASIQAQQAAKQAVSIKDASRASLERDYSSIGAYIEAISAGDRSKILSSGMEIRDARSPIGELPAPLSFLATMGDDTGEIDLSWSRVHGAKAYIVQSQERVDSGIWQQAKIVTKRKATIAKLISGRIYSFRVAAIGTAGQGPWSDESVKMAP